jgi:hypothetical protein
MPAPAIKTPTRRNEVEATVGPPPAPPAVPKTSKPPAATAAWTPAPLACSDYTVKGSQLRSGPHDSRDPAEGGNRPGRSRRDRASVAALDRQRG